MTYFMICSKCKVSLDEKEIQVSHDVPKYMFEDKQEADKWGRHNLCKKCHDIYERLVFSIMVKDLDELTKMKLRTKAKNFANYYFKKEEGHGDTTKTTD